jgi:hypothetical protein
MVRNMLFAAAPAVSDQPLASTRLRRLQNQPGGDTKRRSTVTACLSTLSAPSPSPSYLSPSVSTARRRVLQLKESQTMEEVKMRFMILAAAVLMSTVGVTTTAGAAHHTVVGHRQLAPAPVITYGYNSPSVVAMPLPLRPWSAQGSSAAAPRSTLAAVGASAAPRSASTPVGTSGPAPVGASGRSDRSGGRAASF